MLLVNQLPSKLCNAANGLWHGAGRRSGLLRPSDSPDGAAVFCGQVGEITAMFQLAMAGRLRYQDLQDMILAHPTWGEVLNNAFQRLKPGE